LLTEINFSYQEFCWDKFSITFAIPKKGIVLIFYAEVAQLVEQLICNQQVAGSIPLFGSEKLSMHYKASCV
jgi:hypothetical protein